ncbi:uncharacterized protein J4E78_004225 [Alternaria triticimaculans]|uniref:uncharacterized protein n=1 Tax=Alternaria triticimaculans TaxID=297637 RepID=UPI0020C3CC61|nr:uncharacterized protein J4E78_004225 [Alternaria triticimaculans]KAI4663806.1 hypothetical protein J4E78_004225 [Alternaria triticimaculans]
MSPSRQTKQKAMETTLQHLQNELNILKNDTKDLPSEINNLRNKNAEPASKMALVTATVAFTNTVNTLTTESTAKIRNDAEEGRKTITDKIKEFQSLLETCVEETVRGEMIPNMVSCMVLDEMKTEMMQEVQKEYARKAVTVAGPEWIYEKLEWMVGNAVEKVTKRVDELEK